MPDPDEGLDADFDSQLRGLFEQAENVIGSRSAAARPDECLVPQSLVELDREHAPPAVASAAGAEAAAPVEAGAPAGTLAQLLMPVIQGLSALTRVQAAQGTVLTRIDQTLSAPAAAAEAEGLAKVAGELRGLLEQKNGVNQRMFNALYEELKGYKDGFLLESIHRPLIRDLVSLYDDMLAIHRQTQGLMEEVQGALSAMPASALERFRHVDQHVEHNVEFILEVLARMEVTPMEPGPGKLDKRTQRAMMVEPAATAEEDGLIVQTLKRGFLWKERVLRPEEVIAKKWKPEAGSGTGAVVSDEPVELEPTAEVPPQGAEPESGAV